ncbi:MAG: PD40 domain-containing protein [Chloroflexi bacterium]|nr:PD40 domain-containing protein [Chloroflexota bacterium]
MGIGTTKLSLYSPSRNTWEKITDDGARPVWSADGQSIYFIAGTDLMRFDLGTRKTIHAGLSAPDSGTGFGFSRPLSDGRFSDPIDIIPSDQVLLSPQADNAAIAYSASMNGEQLVPAVAVLHRSNGAVIPLLKNCHSSAVKMVWSPSGDRIAYPLHADPPEIRIYDVQSGQTQVVFRNDVFDHLNNLSWSPDGKYLVFTRGDGRGSPAPIWIISTDGVMGQQILGDGYLSNWSPDGKRILYSGRDGWYILKINPTANKVK